MNHPQSKIKTILPIEVTSIRGVGYHCFVMITVNGREMRMVLDTGASRTIFDHRDLQHLDPSGQATPHEESAVGLGTSSMQAHLVTLKKLEIGALTMENFPAGTLNLDTVNQSYQQLGLPCINGILGNDILVAFEAVIDYKNRQIHLAQDKGSGE